MKARGAPLKVQVDHRHDHGEKPALHRKASQGVSFIAANLDVRQSLTVAVLA